MHAVGGESDYQTYQDIGKTYRAFLTEIAGLKPTHDFLDVGCGPGRAAMQLTTYLRAETRYEGLDIVPKEIEWCRKNITPRFPNFHFRLADVQNNEYNPMGRHHASTYRFPYDDESFDFVLLISVFTHMMPLDMENYVSNIARVLKRGGKCLLTFFLLNRDSMKHIDDRTSTMPFDHTVNSTGRSRGRCRTIDPDFPEKAVAYSEDYLGELLEATGLKIQQPKWYGTWTKTFSPSIRYQDIVIAQKN